jgi:hypothetical protein
MPCNGLPASRNIAFPRGRKPNPQQFTDYSTTLRRAGLDQLRYAESAGSALTCAVRSHEYLVRPKVARSADDVNPGRAGHVRFLGLEKRPALSVRSESQISIGRVGRWAVKVVASWVATRYAWREWCGIRVAPGQGCRMIRRREVIRRRESPGQPVFRGISRARWCRSRLGRHPSGARGAGPVAPAKQHRSIRDNPVINDYAKHLSSIYQVPHGPTGSVPGRARPGANANSVRRRGELFRRPLSAIPKGAETQCG